MKKKLTYILCSLLALAYILYEAGGKGDFFIFLSASDDLFRGENIYSKIYLDGFHYLYSQLFAILLKPFTLLPLYMAKALWLALNVFFLYRIIKIAASFFDLAAFSEKKKLWFLLGSLIFGMYFIRSNFHHAQVTIFILWLALEGLRFVLEGKEIKGAALIALGINIKLLPAVLLPYLLWRRQFLAFACCVLFCALFLFLPAAFIGTKQNSFLLSEWWKVADPTSQINVIDVQERSFHSLSTLLPTLLMKKVPDQLALPARRNLADLSFETVSIILNITRFLLIFFTLYFMRSLPFREEKNKLKTFWEVSYILLLVPLIFPHQQFYAFLFCIPAAACVLHHLFASKEVNYLLAAGLALVFLCFNLAFLLGQWKDYYEHFKVITWGAVLLIVLLAVCDPRKLLSERE